MMGMFQVVARGRCIYFLHFLFFFFILKQKALLTSVRRVAFNQVLDAYLLKLLLLA